MGKIVLKMDICFLHSIPTIPVSMLVCMISIPITAVFAILIRRAHVVSPPYPKPPDTFSLDLCLGGGGSGITGGEYHSPTIQTPKTSSDSRLRNRPRGGLSVSRWIYGLGGLVRVLQGCIHLSEVHERSCQVSAVNLHLDPPATLYQGLSTPHRTQSWVLVRPDTPTRGILFGD